MNSIFIFKLRSAILIALVASCFLPTALRADSITLQFFLGGFDDIPEGTSGILVADSNNDGFEAVFLAAADGTALQSGTAIAGSDDIILAVTAASSVGFSNGETGF